MNHYHYLVLLSMILLNWLVEGKFIGNHRKPQHVIGKNNDFLMSPVFRFSNKTHPMSALLSPSPQLPLRVECPMRATLSETTTWCPCPPWRLAATEPGPPRKLPTISPLVHDLVIRCIPCKECEGILTIAKWRHEGIDQLLVPSEMACFKATYDQFFWGLVLL